jgi:hypothetical protein
MADVTLTLTMHRAVWVADTYTMTMDESEYASIVDELATGKRILRCQAPLNIRSKKLAECAPVADVSILQLSTTQAQGNNFVIERYNTYCLKTILAAGESGWTPTE